MGIADVVRLFAIPIFGLIAYRDVKFRRVPDRVWYPMVGLAVVTLAYDGVGLLEATRADQQLFLVRVGFSVVFLIGLAGAFYYLGIIDETIAKALGLTAILYPVFPPPGTLGGVFPLTAAPHGVLSLSIVSNAAIVSVLYPLGYVVWNGVKGQFSPVMFAGRLVAAEEVPDRPGRLLETSRGYTLSGLDIEVLREYLHWRGITVSLIRQRPAEVRDPTFYAADSADSAAGDDTATDGDDEWAAQRFVDEVGDAAVTPDQLRSSLNLFAGSESVWVSANFPFVVPVFVGILLVYTLGDLPTYLFGSFS